MTQILITHAYSYLQSINRPLPRHQIMPHYDRGANVHVLLRVVTWCSSEMTSSRTRDINCIIVQRVWHPNYIATLYCANWTRYNFPFVPGGGNVSAPFPFSVQNQVNKSRLITLECQSLRHLVKIVRQQTSKYISNYLSAYLLQLVRSLTCCVFIIYFCRTWL